MTTPTVLDLAKQIRDGHTLPMHCKQHPRYQKGCANCQQQASDRTRAHNLAAAYGWRTPDELLPAEPARNHLNHLHTRHHISYRHAANIAGISPGPVHKIATGVQLRATGTTINAILSVQPDHLRRAPRGNILAIGDARRLQGLMYLGFRAEDIAPLIDTDTETVRRWRRCFFPSITPARHEQIVAVTDRLDGTRGPSLIAHRRAVGFGWVPVSAWDDIDDPDEKPHSSPTEPAADLVDDVLVRRVHTGHAPLTALNPAEQVALWHLWRRHQQASQESAGVATFARRYGIEEHQARRLQRAATSGAAPRKAA